MLTILENRRKYVKKMAEQGLSIYDIARFFETTPTAIKRSLNATETTANTINHPLIDELMRQRDRMIQRAINEDKPLDTVLEELGLFRIPSSFKWSKEVITRTPKHPIYEGFFEGLSEREIAKKMGVSLAYVKQQIRDLEISKHEATMEARKYKNRNLASIFLELKADGFRGSDIEDYLNITEKEKEKLCSQFWENKFKIDNSEKAKELALYGVDIHTIHELTGIQYNQISDIINNIRGKSDKPFAYKTEERRRICFELYTRALLTKEQIAELLNITRHTVYSDIKKYQQDHFKEMTNSDLERKKNEYMPYKSIRLGSKTNYRVNGHTISTERKVTYSPSKKLPKGHPYEGKSEKEIDDIRKSWQDKSIEDIMKETQLSRMAILFILYKDKSSLQNGNAIPTYTIKDVDKTIFEATEGIQIHPDEERI